MRSEPDRLSLTAPAPEAVPPAGVSIPPVDVAAVSGRLVDGPRGNSAQAPALAADPGSEPGAASDLSGRGSKAMGLANMAARSPAAAARGGNANNNPGPGNSDSNKNNGGNNNGGNSGHGGGSDD